MFSADFHALQESYPSIMLRPMLGHLTFEIYFFFFKKKQQITSFDTQNWEKRSGLTEFLAAQIQRIVSTLR